jgi:hypothetical protein
MKERKGKERTNAIKMDGENGGNGGKDRLENKNMKVNSTCRVRTAEKKTLAGSNVEDFWTKRHQDGCKEKSANDEI